MIHVTDKRSDCYGCPLEQKGICKYASNDQRNCYASKVINLLIDEVIVRLAGVAVDPEEVENYVMGLLDRIMETAVKTKEV